MQIDNARLPSVPAEPLAAQPVQLLSARAADVGMTAGAPAPAEARAARTDRFIAILGHELRGRLAPAQTALGLLNTATLDATKTRWAYELIERQLDGMTRLVDDLLEVARLRSGSLRLRRETVALADLVERSVEIVRPQIASRGHTLLIRLPHEPIFIDADVTWFCQALQNLLHNAAKFTAPGGQIGIDAHREGNEAVLTVSDTGVGIDPAYLERVFDPYFQTPSSTLVAGKGLGIGLYLVRLLVEAHGGTIHAARGPRCGSELVVRVSCRPR